MIVAAALSGRGHARLLALDCSPAAGGVRAGRLVAESDLTSGSYAGEQIENPQYRTPVTVTLPATLGEGIHRDVYLEVSVCP